MRRQEKYLLSYIFLPHSFPILSLHSMDINNVTLIWTIISAPEIKYKDNGSCYATLRISVVSRFSSFSGNKTHEKDEITILLWNWLATWGKEHLIPGDKAYFEWRLQIRPQLVAIDNGKTTVEVAQVVAERVVPHNLPQKFHKSSHKSTWNHSQDCWGYVERE